MFFSKEEAKAVSSTGSLIVPREDFDDKEQQQDDEHEEADEGDVDDAGGEQGYKPAHHAA
jgi:hypothetical protein